MSLTRIAPRDLVSESLAGLLQRPVRTGLTMLGTLLGIGAFVAILGLTTTVGGQIDQQFNALTATTVSVSDVGSGDAEDNPLSFPADAVDRIDRLNGVIAAGIAFIPPGTDSATIGTNSLASSGADTGLSVEAVDVGTFAAIHATVISGRVFDPYYLEAKLPVAVLGRAAAQRLGILRLTPQTVVFVGDDAYSVIGIIADPVRLPELASAVMIPATLAVQRYGQPTASTYRPTMTIETRLGAAQLVARQAAIELRPDDPNLFKTTAPQDPTALRGTVQTAVNSLFLLLAGITLVIGAVGIANITLVSVLERTGEIGLRRALGARQRHIALQFISESTAIGLLGGLIGTSLGVATIILTALSRGWTTVINPWTVPAGPAIGALVGVLAGLYPAIRAARIPPAAALTR